MRRGPLATTGKWIVLLAAPFWGWCRSDSDDEAFVACLPELGYISENTFNALRKNNPARYVAES
jgi:hypothetical protein